MDKEQKSDFEQYYEGFEKSERCFREESILKFWEENDIFEKSLQKESLKGEYIFYEGPPSANGHPGIHHLEARFFKDIIPRFKTMQGYHVRRKAGWDTHGLPIELQAEKELGLNSKKEVESYGIVAFNQKCKESVWKYKTEWEDFTHRSGYWVDMRDPYVTYHNNYIESLWNIVKKVDEQKLLYKDYKVVPWCPRCGTALSSHELAQGYEDVKELSVVVKFKITSLSPKAKEVLSNGKDVSTYLLAWTTTPWTLPGNVALAVGKNLPYSVVSHDGNQYILAEALIEKVFHDKEYTVLQTVTGEDLIGIEYEPLYPFTKNLISETEQAKLANAYKVYSADFVTIEDGTGVVHTAVMYGQDDFELGTQIGLPKCHLIDEAGVFLKGTDFLSGRFVKEKNGKGDDTLSIDIIKELAGRPSGGLLFDKFKYEHSYPFCWRCSTPLIYFARDSWYIKMSSLRDKLVSENETIHWEPDHIKEGRFGEWLRGIKDWAISRERYWGTPLPIWEATDGSGEHIVIGSFDEIKKYSKNSGNTYYLLRHAHAVRNETDTWDFAGDPDNHLTEMGRQQVIDSANIAKKENTSFDLMISSPMLRAKETAKLFAENMGYTGEIIEDNNITEIHVGDAFQGKPFDDFLLRYKNYSERYIIGNPDGESYADVKRRAMDFLYECEQKYKDKKILIVSHGCPILNMILGSRGILHKDVPDKIEDADYPENAQIKRLNFVPLPHNADYELDVHRPFVDDIILVKDGKEYRRVKEVMDVWFDSGAMPFAQDHYPFENAEFVEKKGFPADYISEGMDQTRGWFYTLHAIGVLMGFGKAFKNVVTVGLINDESGQKMSKSKGNVVNPWEMMAKYGADPLRMWMYYVTQPGDTKNFSEVTLQELVNKVFNMLDNIVKFYEMFAVGASNLVKDTNTSAQSAEENILGNSVSGAVVPVTSLNSSEARNPSHILDKWIIAKTNELINNVTKNLESYKIMEPSRALRDFILDFSQWYIRRSRDRFKTGSSEDRADALATTRYALHALSLVMSPFTPFTAEEVWQKVRSPKDSASVHLATWPEIIEYDKSILSNMERARSIVSLALEARQKAGIKVRQPLSLLTINLKDKENLAKDIPQEYLNIISDEVNVKKIIINESASESESESDSIVLNTEITPELEAEGNMRDFLRALQDIRKEKGLQIGDMVILTIFTDNTGRALIEKFKDTIATVACVKEFVYADNNGHDIAVGDIKFAVTIG